LQQNEVDLAAASESRSPLRCCRACGSTLQPAGPPVPLPAQQPSSDVGGHQV